MTCAIEGCERTDIKTKRRGWCAKHYRRWERTGDPERTKYDLGPEHCRSRCPGPIYRDGLCHDHYLTSVVWPLPVVLADPYPGWHYDAACRHDDAPDAFFPMVSPPPPKVIEMCAGCPVRGECATVGLREPFGIFGGLDSQTRRNVRRNRARYQKVPA